MDMGADTRQSEGRRELPGSQERHPLARGYLLIVLIRIVHTDGGISLTLLPRLIGAGLAVITAVGPAWASGDSTKYLPELIQRSREMNLSRDRYWHLLLHDDQNWFGGFTSEANGETFFNSLGGKTNPRAELEATLAAFFAPPADDSVRQHPQCRFRARYHWLKSQLGFDPRRLPEQDCPRYRAWREILDPGSVTLIFPASYMNNPSSMFGHTLLRLDRKGRSDENRLLDYTLNYAADVDTANGALFAIKGLTGGFRGNFSTIPYYLKVQAYGDIENRDIWEYRLRLTPEQIDRMLMHTWELGNVYFEYYFLKKNCSYELLTLLEVAEPRLRLTDRFWLYAIPSDTVRVLIDAGIAEAPIYRPSRSRQIEERALQLTRSERSLIRRFLQNDRGPASDIFKTLPDERRALLLDIASDLLIYRGSNDPDQADEYKKAFRDLLRERSTLAVQTPDLRIGAPPAPPEQGHRTARIGLGLGMLDSDIFEEISIRPGYQDLMADDVGYTAGSQIEILNARIRYYNDARRAVLDRLDVVNIVSLFPVNWLFQKPSWKVRVGVDTARDLECVRCNFYNANLGIGGAIRTHGPVPALSYAFIDGDANYGEVFTEKHRVGGGVEAGSYLDPLPGWRIHLSGAYRTYPLGDRSSYFIGTAEGRFRVTKDLDLRLALHEYSKHREGLLTLFVYF